jgi:major membrane immunogen (membrane-anchored lipoprotein)
MTDLIERVAKAIMLARPGECSVKDWKAEAEDNPHVAQAMAQARAAIEAMRESVDAMAAEREAAGVDVYPGNIWLADEFRAMIDAALNTGGRDD